MLKVLEGTPHGMKNSVLTLYLLYVYLFLDILTCIKCSFKVFGLFILVNNGKKSAMGFRVEFIYYFASVSPQPLNRILHLNEK